MQLYYWNLRFFAIGNGNICSMLHDQNSIFSNWRTTESKRIKCHTICKYWNYNVNAHELSRISNQVCSNLLTLCTNHILRCRSIIIKHSVYCDRACDSVQSCKWLHCTSIALEAKRIIISLGVRCLVLYHYDMRWFIS